MKFNNYRLYSFYLLPLFIVFFFLLHEKDEGFGYETFYLIFFNVFIVLFSLIVFSLNYIISKNKELSIFLLSIFLFYALFFKYIYQAFYPIFNFNTLTFIFMFFYLCIGVALRGKVTSFLVYLHTVIFIFIGLEIFKGFELSNKKNNKQNNISMQEYVANPEYPNVYLIMLDGYAKKSNLKKYWSFDNSSFETEITNLGFFNVSDSYTKYNYTLETVASMLTFKDVIPSSTYKDLNLKKKNNLLLEASLLNKPQLINTFQNKGYVFHNLFVSNVNGSAPINYPFSNDQIFRNTIFPALLSSTFSGFGSFLALKIDKERINKVANTSINKNRPFFLYYHSMIPHFPFFLKKDMSADLFLKTPDFLGQLDNPLTKISNFQKKHFRIWRQHYIGHIRKTNSLVLPLIKEIMRKDGNAIIVVASDHGSRLLYDVNYEEGLKESFENISFVYFPDRNYSTLSLKMTPTELMLKVQQKALNK